MPFGDKWRKQASDYWDAMADRCAGLRVDEVLAERVRQCGSLLEVGCGAGHTAELLFARGYAGTYWGCDISPAAIAAARSRLGDRATLEVGRLKELSASGDVPSADVLVARSVLQHQAHWLPFVETALQHAPLAMFIVIRNEFVKESGEHETRHRGSYYDVRLSIEAMYREASAAGIALDVSRIEGRLGPEVLFGVRRV
jgi:trans-aconitate methyltransferase